MPKVIVKFNAGYVQRNQVPYDDRIEQHPEQYLGQNWTNLVRQFPGLTIERTVTSLTPQQLIDVVLDAKRKSAQHGRTYDRPDNHFHTFFAVRPPSGIDPMLVAAALRTWGGTIVDLAYVEGKIKLASWPTPGTTTENIAQTQPYLRPAPVGIDAEYAWTIPGGDGGGNQNLDLRFADMEQGWDLTHPELPSSRIQFIYGQTGSPSDPNYNNVVNHGTSVLGIVLAVPNNVGCVGITPNVTTTFVTSCYPQTPDEVGVTDVATAIAAVIPSDNSKLRSGDVLLLEAQLLDTNAGLYVPLEVDSTLYEWIYSATARDIVVIEPAGNAPGTDLDQYQDTYNGSGNTILNRGSPQFRSPDSLAIMVGAASSGIPHTPTPGCNFGSRVDCYGWGDRVGTTLAKGGYGTLSDTSAAAAIIAGAALSIQGIAQQGQKGDLSNSNYRFSPWRLRSQLRNPATGTVSGNSTWKSSLNSTWDPVNNPDFSKWNADRIGVMPNLKSIIMAILPPPPPPPNTGTAPAAPTGLRVS